MKTGRKVSDERRLLHKVAVSGQCLENRVMVSQIQTNNYNGSPSQTMVVHYEKRKIFVQNKYNFRKEKKSAIYLISLLESCFPSYIKTFTEL